VKLSEVPVAGTEATAQVGKIAVTAVSVVRYAHVTPSAALYERGTMATWSEVKDFIRTNFTVAFEDANLMRLQFDAGNGRSQLIVVMGLETGDEFSSVLFFSPFAQEGQISPSQFLELARNTTFGLAVVAGLMGYVHNAFLADLDASEIRIPMLAVTGIADQTERRLGLGDRL